MWIGYRSLASDRIVSLGWRDFGLESGAKREREAEEEVKRYIYEGGREENREGMGGGGEKVEVRG